MAGGPTRRSTLSNLASAVSQQAAKTCSLRWPAVAYAQAIMEMLCLSSVCFLRAGTPPWET